MTDNNEQVERVVLEALAEANLIDGVLTDDDDAIAVVRAALTSTTDADRKVAEVREAIDARDDEVRSCHSPGSREAESIIASGSALIPTSVIRTILDSEARS